MTSYPLTWTEAAKFAPADLYTAIINMFVEEYPFLGALPISPWPGGEAHEYGQNQTLPTIAGVDETDTISSTKSTRRKLKCRLSQRAGQIENPIFLNSTLDNVLAQEEEAILDLVRSYAVDLGGMVLNGAYNGSTTIHADSAAKGIDGFTPGPRLDSLDGYGMLKFDDTANMVYFKGPGDTAYGDGVSTASDLTASLIRSSNESMWAYLTMDVSDSEGNGDWEHTTSLAFTKAKSIDGLAKLVDPSQRFYGNGHATTPSTNGDPFALEILDQILDSLNGPMEEQAIVMRKGIRRAAKTLLRAAGGSMVDEWMGIKLKRPTLAWEGVPIFADERITKAETVGGTTTCTSIFGVRMNPVQGVGLFYGAQRGRGATWSTQQAAADTSIFGNSMQFPMYLRGLPERDDKATEPVRITSAMAMYSRHTLAICEAHGISNNS